MFQGTTLITLDDKGRLALPKRARDEAAADGVIVAARHPGAWCFIPLLPGLLSAMLS